MAGSVVQSTRTVDDSGATSLTVAATLNGVAAGNSLLAFVCWGNAAGVTISTATDGTAYTSVNPGVVINATDNQNSQLFILPNAGSGTHTFTVTFGTAAAFRRLRLIEVSGVQSSPVDQGAGQAQNTVGTTANSISSGNMAATTNAADFIVAFTQDTTNVDPGSGTMGAGTSFTISGTDQILSLEARSVAATGTYAGTFTDTKNSNRTTHVVALKETAAVVDQPPQAECGDSWAAATLGEIEGSDLGPWDWYQDDNAPNRGGVEPPIPERLPESFEWVDPNDTDEALYQWPLSHAPPPADVDTYVYDGTIHDSSTQLEDVDQDFAFFDAPSPAAIATDQIWPEDASTQLEDVDEDFGFADAPRAADVIVADFIAPELGNDQPDEDEFAEGFRDDPLPDDILDQLFNEFGHFDDPTDEPVDEGWFAAPLDAAQADDSSVAQECPQPPDEEDAPEGFAASPLADDNDVSAPCVTPDQADEPEDEPFGFDAQPQADDVQSDQVFTESGDWWPDDVVEEPEGFACDPTVPELVIEEPLPFCDFPAQAEEPEDEDFGIIDFQTPDDVIPVPTPVVDVIGKGGGHRKPKRQRTDHGPTFGEQFKADLQRVRLRERIAQEDEEILALVAAFVSVMSSGEVV